MAGNLYFNIHTAAFPGGEVRGQVYLSSGTDFQAGLTAEQQTHTSTSVGSGSASVVLTEAGLFYNLTLDDITGEVTGAHLHLARAGEDGAVVHNLSDNFVGNNASGFWSADGITGLNDSLRNELLAGNIYFNIHTADNPAGEIRGQLSLNSGIGLTAHLSPEQQPHLAVSTGAGSSALTLTNAGLVFDVTLSALSGPVTAAHLHHAEIGSDGPAVRTITADFADNTAFGVWTASDSEPLTLDQMTNLMNHEIYYNIHTTLNPTGEIRGQIQLLDILTAIEVVDEGGVPNGFSLTQNYPNPFNPITTIQFSVLQATDVRLGIYNVLGQKVADLVNERKNAGTYDVTFSASQIASGVYYYKLQAGDYSSTRKMTILK